MKQLVSDEVIRAIIQTEHHDPFQILGLHKVETSGKPAIVVRAFRPDATSVYVVDVRNGDKFPMQKLHKAGFFEVVIDKRSEAFPYRLGAAYPSGATTEYHDSYGFIPTLGELDLYLFNQGNHHLAYEKLGAHPMVMDFMGTKVDGIAFAVWAPNAKRVSVIGDFNHWDGRAHVMRSLGNSGVWEIFVPGLGLNQNYKYEVKTQDDSLMEKSDPFAFYAEIRPKTASKIYDISGYSWADGGWMDRRPSRDWLKEPVSIYECHLGSWARVPDEGNRFLTYRELAPRLTKYLKDTGYTHLELLPVTEHPLDASWGYQVTGFFAPTSRFGSPRDFMYFVDHLHQNDIGVILDWVPAHFPKDYHGLARFDGTALYEHSDPRQGEHRDWDTFIFNYGRNEVKNFLISSALFWLDKYHIDGLRVDAVASMLYLDYSRKDGEWIPNRYGGRENLEAIEFLKYMNSITYQKYPGIMTIAEESTAYAGVSKPCHMGGLGFGFKWNMGWMNDTLTYFVKDPIYRTHHQSQITFPLIYAFHENFINVISHDEVVHGKGSLLGKMPGDVWQKFANCRLLYAFMYGMPGKKLTFMGADIGQWNEWNSNQSLDWNLLEYESHQGLNRLVTHLNHLYKNEPALHQKDCDGGGFCWIDFSDAVSSIASWYRKGDNPDELIVFVANLTPVPRQGYRVGLPRGGFFREILNTDSTMYYGSNIGNHGGVWAEPFGWQGQPFSAPLNLPPLAMVAFKLMV